MNFSRSYALRLATGLSALALSALVTGCGIGTINTASGTVEGTLQISGKAFGGLQPVNGANIQVFTAGNTGYGTGAISIMSTTVSTDANGFFLLTGKYTCPSSTSLVYITATGGDPGIGNNNSAIKLASAIGTCATLQSASYVWINEVTTAATAFALAQFYTPAGGFGAPNNTQAQAGLTNAFATVGNLVDFTNGTAITTLTKTSGLGNITVTPEPTKLNTLANILSSCVNSDGGSTSVCQTTLFPDVTPTAGTAPTNTLSAAVLMNTNPTSNNANGSAANMTALYGLQTATSPYGGLSAQPTDWTVGINYSAGTGAANTLMNLVADVAADSGGNIWLINAASGTTAAQSMAEFSPTGTPLANPFNSGATSPASMAATTPRNIAIDTNNNVFATTSSGSSYTFEYSAGGVSSTFATGGQGYAISIDGSNNLWIGQNSSSASSSLTEFTSGTLAGTNEVKYPLLTGTTNTLLATYNAVSTDGSIWLASGATTNLVYQATGMNPGTCTVFPCTTANDASLAATYTQSTGTFATPWGVTAAPGGVMWIANNTSGNNTLTRCTSTTACTTVGSASSLNGPRKTAVDGAGNIWVANRGSAVISEFSSTGAVLSPTPVSPATTPIGFAHSGIGTGSSITLDPSGNVWIGNNTLPTAGSDPDSIFELVGAAAPTVTPLSLALASSKVGVKP